MRKLKIASALAACGAALALGIAAPASAAPTGAQALAGFAYANLNQDPTGGLVPLLDNQIGQCLPLGITARSVEHAGLINRTITLYSTSNCASGTDVSTVTQTNQLDSGFTAVAYTVT